VFYGLHILAIGSTIFAILFYYALCILLLGIRWSRRKKVKTEDPEENVHNNRSNRVKMLLQTHRVTFGLLCAIAVVLSFTIPLVLRDTCICIFSKDHGISILNGTAVFSTHLIRSFTVEKQCKPGPPCHVYATLPSNTSSSVFLNVHTDYDVESVTIEYDLLETFKETGKLSLSATSYSFKLDVEERGKRAVHSTLLKGLEAQSVYFYRVVYDGQAHYNSTYKTLPKEGEHEPVIMVLGGDVGSSDIGLSVTESLQKVGVPDVLVIGGDAAYDDGLQACYYSWDLYLHTFENLNSVVNRTIPFIISVGNHDIGFNSMSMATVDENELPLYYLFVPQHYKIDEKTGEYVTEVPEMDKRKTIFYHLIGNTIQLSLDSGYVETYEDQAKWMRALLPKFSEYAKFANYHVPIFPACTQTIDNPMKNRQVAMDNFVPVFEEFKFGAIFENHVHLFKKTFPLIQGKMDKENGIVYYGDGNWGVTPNQCLVNGDLNNQTKTLEVATAERHVWILKISPLEYEIYPVNASGIQFYPSDKKHFKSKNVNLDL